MQMFPNGWWPYLVGGLLAGAGVGGVFLSTGLRAGASSVFTTTWSWVSGCAYFRQPQFREARVWRLVFSVGLVAGAAAFALAGGRGFVTDVSPLRLLVGGAFVGFGTRLSRGCTSGHGICGISAGSKASILAVVVFMGVAIVVAHAMRAAGVAP
jgi:hypothetical protein